MEDSSANRGGRGRWRRACAACAAALVAGVLAAAQAQAQTCPAVDPNQNYNCPVGPIYTLPDWGNVSWSLPEYYTTIVAGDLDGDGRDELIGRGALGVHVWSFDSTLGVWHPWVRTDRKGLLVLPLSDAAQWSQPQYGSTIKLIALTGHAGKVLAARSANGLILYELTRGTLPGVDLPAGVWTQLTQSGPFADGDCFNSNNQCWNAAPYYQTIRFGDIDGQPGDEATGWGGDGGVAFKWNGSDWQGLTGFPPGIDAAPYYPANVLSRQFADVDGEPGQELLNWEQEGIRVHKYVPGPNGGAWTELALLAAFGVPTCIESNGGNNPSCWSTLQTAPWSSGGAVVLMQVPGCNNNGGGMSGARYNPTSRAWNTLFTGGPFDDCSGFTQPQYYQTIRFARLTGNTLPEMYARGPGGILTFQWNGTSWAPLSTNVPALADSTWALDPSYWQSIGTANADGSGRAALIARGQTGVRTWLWQGGTLARPLPYGGYPQFTGAEATAFAALNQFLGIAGGGTIRNTYADPGVDNTSSTLRGYVSQIVNARSGCQIELSGNPPQYQTCDPLVGTTNPAYTTMVNQIIKELWWAASVVDRFTTVQTMQSELFAVQGTELPSIADNLQLPQGASGSALVNYMTLFANVASLIGDATGVTQINVGADAVNIVLSALAFFNDPASTVFQHTYANIQGQIASLQQAAQANILAQKHFVLSDYALLSSVGQLVASQAWTIDEAGYLSASRQAFTTWVYQGFLTALWSYYDVVGCGQSEDSYIECYVPPDGGNMQTYNTYDDANGTYVDFTGLLPTSQDSICSESCDPSGRCTNTCQFPTPSPTTVNVLTTPVSSQCTYNPQAGTAWVYANPSANPPVVGCTLGATPAAFGWKFPVVQVNTNWGAMSIDKNSSVTGIGSDARLRVDGIARSIGMDIDLGRTTLTVHRLLDESRSAGELVRDHAGGAYVPAALRPSLSARGRKATFATPPGSSPHLEIHVYAVPLRGELRFDIAADTLQLAEPLLCRGTPPTTRLHMNVEIAGGGLPEPRVLAQVQDWECVFDLDGKVTALRATANGAYGFASR